MEISEDDAKAIQVAPNGEASWQRIQENMQHLTVERGVYSAQGNKVPGFLIKPKSKGPFPVVFFLRGGYKEFDAIRLYDLCFTLGNLAREGFAILTTQKQGGLGAEGKDTWGGDEHLADIENLLEAVRDDTSLQLDRLGIWAGSRGGVEAFRFVKKHPEAVQGVLTIGAPTDLRSLLDCRPDFRKVFQEAFNMKEEELDARSIASWWRSFPQNVPVLCLHGSEDKRIPVKQAEILQRISPRLVVQIVEGGNHPLFNWPERQETITRFFRRSLYNTVEQAGMNEI